MDEVDEVDEWDGCMDGWMNRQKRKGWHAKMTFKCHQLKH